MVPSVPRVIFGVVVVFAIAAFAAVYIRTWSGRAVRGVLHVPKGNTRIKLDVYDSSVLRPFKFGQAFEVTFDPDERTLTRAGTDETRTEKGALLLRNKPIGFLDGTHPYAQALETLAHRYPTVAVQVVIVTLDGSGEPVIEADVANSSWFRRALREDMLTKR